MTQHKPSARLKRFSSSKTVDEIGFANYSDVSVRAPGYPRRFGLMMRSVRPFRRASTLELMILVARIAIVGAVPRTVHCTVFVNGGTFDPREIASRQLLEKQMDHNALQARDLAPLPLSNAHSCFLIYPLEGISSNDFRQTRLRDLIEAQSPMSAAGSSASIQWIVSEAMGTITGARGERLVWESASLVPGDDLHPYIRRMLGDPEAPAADDASMVGEGMRVGVYRLSESARKLVSGERLAYERELPREDRRPLRLATVLTPSARKRIERRISAFDADVLEFEVRDVRCAIFSTGYAFQIVEVQFGRRGEEEIDPYLIVEGLYSLSRFNRTTWRNHQGKDLEQAPVFPFGAMLAGLAGQIDAGSAAERVFTASYVQFSEQPDLVSLERFMVQLSRHYNDDYQIIDKPDTLESLHPFKNIAHLFALEGCATVVSEGGYDANHVPDFVSNFQEKTYRRHYLPVVLLAYHEYNFLLGATNDASFWQQGISEAATIERMNAARHTITNFMLCFRFSCVSRITMHNQVNAALRKALGLDRMLEELNRDTAEIDNYLARAAIRRRERQTSLGEQRFRWVSVIGIFGVSWLTSFTIFKEILGLKNVHGLLHLPQEKVGLVATAIGVIVGLIAGAKTWLKGVNEHGDGLTDNAAHEKIVQQAKRGGRHKK